MRTINADELKANLHKWFPQYTLEGIEAKTLFAQILADIDNAPTVELVNDSQRLVKELVKGEWVKVKEERMSVDMSGEIVTRYKCSKCGRVIATFPNKLADYYPFCHCGADMRKGGVEE